MCQNRLTFSLTHPSYKRLLKQVTQKYLSYGLLLCWEHTATPRYSGEHSNSYMLGP